MRFSANAIKLLQLSNKVKITMEINKRISKRNSLKRLSTVDQEFTNRRIPIKTSSNAKVKKVVKLLVELSRLPREAKVES